MEHIVTQGGVPVPQQMVALTDESGNLINPAGTSGTTFCDQVAIATDGQAVALPAHAMKNNCIVKSLSSNNVKRQTTSTNSSLTNATAGVSGATAGYILEPGEAAPYSASSTLTNTSQIYVNGWAGDVFSIIGS